VAVSFRPFELQAGVSYVDHALHWDDPVVCVVYAVFQAVLLQNSRQRPLVLAGDGEAALQQYLQPDVPHPKGTSKVIFLC